MRSPQLKHSRRHGGTILPLLAICLIPLCVLVAFGVDTGWILSVKAELQLAADAAASAGARQLPDQEAVETVAQKYADYNHPNEGTILASSDVVMGRWDDQARTFTALDDLPAGTSVNAVRTTLRRTRATNNPVPLYFGRVMGLTEVDVTTEAIAVRPLGIGGRFLLDDEMFDTDEPWIEPLKTTYSNTAPVETFITDGNGDFFIDLYDYLPANNKRILVRTGQIGDEAMFDITANNGTSLPQFPFGPTTSPSFTDFLRFNKSGSPSPWVYSNSVESKLLPELKGVGRFNDPSKFSELVNPDFIHVSPIYKSDVNSSDAVGQPAAVGVVGAKDERRGLVAFKIVGSQADPRGGSYLPNLLIEIVNPALINLNSVQPVTNNGGGRVRLVR